MPTLTVEWRHLEVDGGTCSRCSETGKSLRQVIGELEEELRSHDVELSFIQTTLPEEKLPQSNMILINGRPLEDILTDAKTGENYCSSCSCLTGEETYCRTVRYDGETHEEISKELIRQAVLTALEHGPQADGRHE